MDTVAIVHDVSRTKHRHVLLHMCGIRAMPDRAASHTVYQNRVIFILQQWDRSRLQHANKPSKYLRMYYCVL